MWNVRTEICLRPWVRNDFHEAYFHRRKCYSMCLPSVPCTECYSSLTKNVKNRGKFYQAPYVKCVLHCTDFRETQNFSLALFGDVFYRVLHTSVEKYGKYERKCIYIYTIWLTEPIWRNGHLLDNFVSINSVANLMKIRKKKQFLRWC
jgi:uncharacterized membrane protein